LIVHRRAGADVARAAHALERLLLRVYRPALSSGLVAGCALEGSLLTRCYRDLDGDGRRSSTAISTGVSPPGYVELGDDCTLVAFLGRRLLGDRPRDRLVRLVGAHATLRAARQARAV
jgi:hypothetical protein